MLRISILFVLVSFVLNAYAQNTILDVRYNGIFDNREYSREINNEKESITGSHVYAAIGPKLDNNEHCIRVGLNYFYEFGSEFLEIKPTPILYYAYSKPNLNFYFGAFSRQQLPKFPLAFFSERYSYFNPTVDGILLQKSGESYGLSVFGDWVSRQNVERREQFLLGLSANIHSGNWLLNVFCYQYHNGGRTIRIENDYIDDYLGGVAMLGYNFSDLIHFDKAEINSGWLLSSHRDRLISKTHAIRQSSYSEIRMEKSRIGLEMFLKFGDFHELAFGDQFYANVNNYIRTNLYLIPIRTSHLEAKFTWAFHTYNGRLDHQQVFLLLWRFK